jgi:hypothetical protein
MQKDFITVTPDNGNGDATVTVAASENQSENARSSTITIAGGGISRTVSLGQNAGSITYEYDFDENPKWLQISRGSIGEGNKKTVSIPSTMKKIVNGNVVETSNASWSYKITETFPTGTSPDFMVIQTSSDSISFYAKQLNTTDYNRTIYVDVIQSESGKTKSITIAQLPEV